MTRAIIEPTAAGAVPGWTLGWRLKRALAHADLGTEEIAQELGVVRATISRWTNDKGAPPRPIYVRQWALRTGVSYDWLASGAGDATSVAEASGAGVDAPTPPAEGRRRRARVTRSGMPQEHGAAALDDQQAYRSKPG